MTAKKPITSGPEAITDGQKKHVRRLAEDACDRAFQELELDRDALQRVIASGDVFQERIITALRELAIPDEFANEEVESSYGYPAGYSPKPIAEQVAILKRLWPILGSADESLATEPLPDGAEAYFAIPPWQNLGPTYPQALQLVIAKVQVTLGDRFKNLREGALTENHVRLTERTAARLKQLGEEQKGHDILIVPAQFGKRHAGRSARRASVVFTSSEFGLDPFSVGIMLLTHPERLQKYEDLWVDCAGADYRPSGSGAFRYGLCFGWGGGKLCFVYDVLDVAHRYFGSASGFAAPS